MTKTSARRARYHRNPGVFQALCHTSVFVFQIEFVKGRRFFFHAENTKKSAGGLQSAISPQISLGQSPGGGPRVEASGSSS